MNMDCDYFKSHIQEELEGAKEYAKAALEIKAVNPSWANTYVSMCSQELIHAKNFYEMFNDYYEKAVKPYSEPPKYFKDKREDIMNLYTECYTRVKWLLEMVSK